MAVIELTGAHPTLDEVMGLANDGVVVLRRPDGPAFARSRPDDFGVEVEWLGSGPDFLSVLKRLSREDASISMASPRQELAL
jgi:hypothetical protein